MLFLFVQRYRNTSTSNPDVFTSKGLLPQTNNTLKTPQKSAMRIQVIARENNIEEIRTVTGVPRIVARTDLILNRLRIKMQTKND